MDMSSKGSKEKSLIDIVKFLFSLLIVSAHFASEYGDFSGIIDYSFSLYIVVVPFFFCCSGYFLYKKVTNCNKDSDEKSVYKKYIIRILDLYLRWSLIYIIFKILDWGLHGVTLGDLLHYFHTAIVFTTYPTIWFLPACMIAAVMIYFLNKRLSLRAISIVALILYVVGSIGYSYQFLIPSEGVIRIVYNIYTKIFITTRNGIFNGFPWFVLGCLIAEYEKQLKKHRVLYSIGTVLSLGLIIIEAVLIKIYFHSSGVDTVFSLIPFTFCLMMLLIKEDMSLKQGKWLRNMSTLIFVSQRIFLTALPAIFPEISFILTYNSYLGEIIILSSVVCFSAMVIAASKKYSILRKLW